jgi:hypothetical protein
MKDPEFIINQLSQFDIENQAHTDKGLISHLKGTYKILHTWGCPEYICLGGLCHSLYGTESYNAQSIPLERRELVSGLIGEEAEFLSYLFGVHKKESLWENLSKEKDFSIADRIYENDVSLSPQNLSDLITLTLANWLEQRPRVDEEYKYLRKEEFSKSKKYLPEDAWIEFCSLYDPDIYLAQE